MARQSLTKTLFGPQGPQGPKGDDGADGTGIQTITPVKTSNYTASAGDLVQADPTSGSFNVTLPLASANAKKVISVKFHGSSTNAVTVTHSGSDTIDGGSSFTLAAQNQCVSFVSDGSTNWIQLSGAVSVGGVTYVVANSMPGADIGAQIQAADTLIGATAGEILTLHGDYTWVTPVVLSTKRHLWLGDGLYTPTHDGNSPTITVDSDTTIEGYGSHWGARIKEPLQGTNLWSSVICDKTSGVAGGSNDGPGITNVVIRNVQFVGIAGNTEHQDGTVIFANSNDVEVSDCFFNETSTYSCVVGGSPALGNYASGARICNNKYIGVATQNIAVVNAINVLCDGNTCLGGDVTRHSTYIDFEANGPLDRLENFKITNNIIDARGGLPSGPGTGIHVSGGRQLSDTPSTKNANGGVIAHNTILGGPIDESGSPVLAGGIAVTLATDVLICDNYVRFCGQEGIGLSASDNCTIDHNDVVDCGPVGPIPITIGLAGARWCTVSNNRLSTQLGGSYWAGIDEISDVEFEQTSDFNMVYGNRLYYSPSQTITNPDHELRITLSGVNSREWDNEIKGQVWGVSGVDNVGALQGGFIPGLRASGVPALARVINYTTAGDRQPRLYYYDPTSTLADNGITVLKPANATNGRWLIVPDDIHLTTTARDALSLTATDKGLWIYNDTANGYEYWNGTAWKSVPGAGGGGGSDTLATAYTNGAGTSDQQMDIDGPHGGEPTLSVTGVNTARTAGLTLKNPDTATSGNQKNSPSLQMKASGWGTGGSAAQALAAVLQLVPRQASNAFAEIYLAIQNGGDSLTDALRIVYGLSNSTTGTCVAIGAPGSAAGALTFNTDNAGTIMFWGGITTIISDAYPLWSMTGNHGLRPGADGLFNFGDVTHRPTEVWSYLYAGKHNDHSTSGAVTIDSTAGEMHVIVSTGNITGITITGGYQAQVLTLEMKQGNAAHTWPTTITNARLAGGVFTKTATLNAVDTLTFRYNSTNSTWDEISRTTNIS